MTIVHQQKQEDGEYPAHGYGVALCGTKAKHTEPCTVTDLHSFAKYGKGQGRVCLKCWAALDSNKEY